MSNQPIKETKRKKGDLNLLERLIAKDPVALGMETPGRYGKYKLLGLESEKMIVASGDEFVASVISIKEAFKTIASVENMPINYYDMRNIVTTYVAEEEVEELKIREECMPKKFNVKTGIMLYDKRFYIVKKRPNGSSSGKIFCLYNWDTRWLLYAHHDKDILIGWLQSRYKDIEGEDI
ncbi:MAG: hypothetical protein DRQ78_10610 [Epsilonproteobacteria bacterium]|nr:MAG: hypothetical protein DRQ78_10610 [Campylobacterota bacterium]